MHLTFDDTRQIFQRAQISRKWMRRLKKLRSAINSLLSTQLIVLFPGQTE
jgi:hypothetical protein